jgi:hypothetical protein
MSADGAIQLACAAGIRMNRFMDEDNLKPANPLKAAIAFGVSVAFLAACIVVGFESRRYQVSGQPMPNGKGGFMTYSDGYEIAAALFLISLAGFVGSCRLWRPKRSRILRWSAEIWE